MIFEFVNIVVMMGIGDEELNASKISRYNNKNVCKNLSCNIEHE